MTEMSQQMDDQELPIELSKALERAERANERAIKSAGYGASDLGLELAKGNIRKLSEHIKLKLQEQHPRGSVLEQVVNVVRPLGSDKLALCGLSSCLHSVAMGDGSTGMFSQTGKAMAAECWAAGLTTADPKLAVRVEKASRQTHSNVSFRRQAARSLAKRAGFMLKRWSADRLVHAGSWLIDCVVTALPDVFEWHLSDEGYKLILKDEAVAVAEAAVAETVMRHPVFQPVAEKPVWSGWTMKHPDPRVGFNTQFLRTYHADVAAAARACIKDGTMQPALDGVNVLQGVAWRINKPILDVIQHCITNKIEVEGLPSPTDVPKPPLPKPWKDMTELEQTLWKMDAHDAKQENNALKGQRLLLKEDMEIAHRLSKVDRWYTPMNCDWRGRVYATCHFNYQREDRVRALFEFADGEPIGEEGLWWLKVHVANCGAFDKIDKRPLEERVQWVDANLSRIVSVANVPLVDGFWKTADKPFLFLAACIELTLAMAEGSSYITRLPVSFDGSCSGLQHLAAMTRDENTAALVNLTPMAEPADVYSTIADKVAERVAMDECCLHYKTDKKTKEVSRDTDPNKLAKMFLDHGITRDVAKRNVMTYSYSSKKFGMASQQQTDLMDKLRRAVLRRKLDEHPFSGYENGSIERPGKAARYIAGHVFEAIEERIHRPAQAMKFLQAAAKALAHEGKPVRWTTPVGIPWVNRYHDKKVVRVRLWMHDRGVKTQIRSNVAVGDEKEIAKDRAANGVAPNFVHACDAAHLLLSVNAAHSQGINQIATVHDSFGCLASRAAEFNKIIRAEFVRMYEDHDVLAEVFQSCLHDLTQHNVHRLSKVPERGTLNLKEILDAPFAFS